MKKLLKRILACVLAAALVVGVVPANVLAADWNSTTKVLEVKRDEEVSLSTLGLKEEVTISGLPGTIEYSYPSFSGEKTGSTSGPEKDFKGEVGWYINKDGNSTKVEGFKYTFKESGSYAISRENKTGYKASVEISSNEVMAFLKILTQGKDAIEKYFQDKINDVEWISANEYVEELSFEAKVYDVLTLTETTDGVTSNHVTVQTVDKDQNSRTVTLDADKKANIYDYETVKLTIPAKEGYKVLVDNTLLTDKDKVGNNYVVSFSMTADKDVAVKYQTYSSNIFFEAGEGYTTTVKDASKTYKTSDSVARNTPLTVEVKPDKGWRIDSVAVTNDSVTDEKDTANVTNAVTDKTVTAAFTTSNKADKNYTITVTATNTNNKLVVNDNSNTTETVTVEGKSYTSDKQDIPAGSAVKITAISDNSVKVTGIEVTVEGETEKLVTTYTPDGYNGSVTFTAGTGKTYTATVQTTSTDSTVAVAELDHATAKITVDEAEIKSGHSVAREKEVTVTVTPDENYYFVFEGLEAAGKKLSVEPTWNKGVATITFKTTGEKLDYKVLGKTDLILKENESAEPVSKSAILKWLNGDATVDTVEAEILEKAFTTPADLTNVELTYYAGELNLVPVMEELLADYTEGIDLGFAQTAIDAAFNLLAKSEYANYPVWVPIDNTAEKTNAEVADTVVGVINQYFGKVLEGLGVDASKLKADAVAALEKLEQLHTFGAQDTEKVQAKHTCADDGTGCKYGAASAETTVTIADTRQEVKIDVATEATVTYGSYATDLELIKEHLLTEGKLGVYYADAQGNNVALGDTYNNKLEIKPTLVGENASETVYEVVVAFPDGDYDYKDAKSDTVKVTIKKASAVVDVTDNNVIKKANISNVKWTDLVTVKPGEEVVINDTVNNIPFVVGVDMLNGTAVAQLDLGSIAIGPISGKAAVEAAKKLAGTDELKFKPNELIVKLEEFGIDLGDETVTEIVNTLVEIQEALGVDVTVEITALDDINDLVPQEIGMYVVGAVTFDNNCETTANATYLVVAAEPVGVAFHDVNNNNARLVTFGEDATMTAFAYDLNDENKTPLDGVMSYRYIGMESDGEPYYSEKAPTQTGTYTVLALYRDNAAAPQKAGLGVGALVIKPAEASVSVEDLTIVPYTKAPVELQTEEEDSIIKSTPDDAKIAVITGSISVDGDFSEDGLSSVVGNLNIDLPERADEVLETVLGKELDTADITVADFQKWVTELKTALDNVEEIQIDTAAFDEILDMLADMPNVTSITFKDDVQPSAIGAYLVGAVVFDPNYTPEVGAGVLLITPEIENDELSWNYNDMNGIITLPVLEEEQNLLAATAAKGSDVKYFIIGTDENGNEVRIHTADISYDSLAEKGFGNGVYTQVAYIPVKVAGSFTIGYPIVRTFVVAPQYVLVDFQPDLNIENAREFQYTGDPIEIPTVVTYADGTKVPAEKLEKYYTVKYVGVDSTGAEYNSTTPPTNVGLYTVTAVYEERNDKGELLYAGVNVGLMAITPAENEVTVGDITVCCDCGCDCTADSIDPDCADCKPNSYTLPIAVASDEMETITIIDDDNGNINILVPEDWNLTVNNNADDVMADLIEQITKLSGLADSNAVSDALDDVIAELQALKDADTPYNEADVDAVIDELIKTLDELNTEKVKDMILELADQVKAIEGIDAATVDEIIAALNAIEDAKTEEDAEEAAAKVIALIEKISGQEIDDITKLALGAIAVQVKAIDFSDIKAEVKAEAKAAIETIIDELKAIKDVDAAGAADGKLGEIIEELEGLKSEIAAAEDEIYSALSELTDALKAIQAELGKINSIIINGALPTDCGVYKVTAIAFGANYKVATDDGTLTIIGHKWGDWYTTKEPTKTEQGEERRDCENCPAYQVRPIDKLPSGGGSSSGGNSGSTTVVKPVAAAGTGDSSSTAAWFGLAIASAGAAIILFFKRKRKEIS